MEKNVIVTILLVALIILSIIQVIQLISIKSGVASNTITGNVAASSGAIDTTGWTENEKMNYEMHGTIPARIGQGSSSSSGMVGGC